MPTPQRKSHPSRWWPLVAFLSVVAALAAIIIWVSAYRDLGLARADALVPPPVETPVAPVGDMCPVLTECELRELVAACDLVGLELFLYDAIGGTVIDLLKVETKYGYDVRMDIEACDFHYRVRRGGEPVVTTTSPPSVVVVYVTVTSPATPTTTPTTVPVTTTSTTAPTEETTTTIGTQGPVPCNDTDPNCPQQ